MGSGYYSYESRSLRATLEGYDTKSADQIFSKRFDSEMNPKGVILRESRDSNDHPNSIPIIIALDVTGSMRDVPHYLIKSGLPLIMTKIIKSGILDPQILFLAVGDHECGDKAPLQVGQFESSDELLDKWLEKVYLEGGGGGNEGESYGLAHYFAGFHTKTDSFEKRNQKGFLFTIGDEPNLKNYSSTDLKRIMGDGQYGNYSDSQLIEKAKETYHVYHLHVTETGAGSIPSTIKKWRNLLEENVIIVESKSDVADKIADIVTRFKFNSTSTNNSITEEVSNNLSNIML